MPARQFNEWLREYQLMPFGTRGEYIRAGRIAAIIANVNRAKHQKAYEPTDFMPELRLVKSALSSAQTPEQMHAAFVAFKQGREKRKPS